MKCKNWSKYFLTVVIEYSSYTYIINYFTLENPLLLYLAMLIIYHWSIRFLWLKQKKKKPLLNQP